MMKSGFFLLALFGLVFVSGPSSAQTGSDAFQLGCGGGCHSSDRKVLKAMPKGNEAKRRQWITRFIEQHPLKRDDLKAAIVNYLVERTQR